MKLYEHPAIIAISRFGRNVFEKVSHGKINEVVKNRKREFNFIRLSDFNFVFILFTSIFDFGTKNKTYFFIDICPFLFLLIL